MADFEVAFEPIDKDESRVVYRAGGRELRGVHDHGGGSVILADLSAWADGTPLEPAERVQAVGRIAEAGFAAGLRRVLDGRGVAIALPAAFEIEVDLLTTHPMAVYREPGRTTLVAGREVDERGLHAYPALTRAWYPSSELISDEDRALIVARLAAHPGVTVEDSARPSDPWRLAPRLAGWRRSLVAVVEHPGGVVDAVAEPAAPPADTRFWRVEVPALHAGGVTGWSTDAARHRLSMAPIAVPALAALRRALFDGARSAAEVEGVRGAVVERGDLALALYADGHARLVGPDFLVALELPERAWAEAWLRHLADAPAGEGVTLLRADGGPVAVDLDPDFATACAAFVQRLIDLTLPLVP